MYNKFLRTGFLTLSVLLSLSQINHLSAACGLTANLGNDTSVCQGYVLDAGNPGNTFSWSTGESTQTITPLTTGTYSVTVSNVSCTAIDAVNVIITSPTTTNYSICQGGTVTTGLQAVNNCTVASSTVTSFSGAIDLTDPVYNRSSSLTPPYSASAVGTAVHYDTYTFTVSVTGSYTFLHCGTANWDTHDAVYTSPFDPLAPATNFLGGGDDGGTGCSSGSNTTVTLTAGTTYVFVAEAFNNTGVGGYTVNITGPGTFTTTIQAPLQWFTTATGGSPIATGETFNPIGVANSGLVNTNTAGSTNYYVACSNTPDCRSLAVLTVNPNPIVNLGNDTTFCGSTVVLDAGNAGATYSWSTGSATQTVSTTTTGTYGVSVNLNGCTKTDSILVTNNAFPVISTVTANPSTICGGGSSQLSVAATISGVQPLSFSNNNRVSIPDNTPAGVASNIAISGISPATLSAASIVSVCLNITHSFDGDLLIVLYAPSGDSAILSNRRGSTGDNYTNTCFFPNATATILSGTAPFSGSYKPDGLLSSIGGNANGLWRLVVSDLAGTDTGSLVNWTLTLNNTAQPVYQWSPSGSLTSSSIGNPVASPTGNTSYNVTVTDPTTNCSATATTSVSVGSGGSSLGADTALCGSSVGLFLDDPSAVSYAWSNGASTSTTSVSATGNYSVTVNNGSCTYSDTIHVTLNTAPVVTLGSDTILCGGSFTLNAGNAGSNYLWSDNSTAQTLTTDSSGTYSVTITDANTCIGSDAIVITVNTPPTFDLGNPITQCGGSVTIDAGSGATTYLWYNSTGAQTLTTSTSGSYAVTITDANNCTASDSVQVTINEVPVVNIGNDTSACVPLVLNAGNAGASFLWSNGDTTATVTLPGNNQTAQLYVIVSKQGCSATDTINLAICDGLEAIAGSSVELFPNPSQGRFTLYFNSTTVQDLKMDLITTGGQLVCTFKNEKATTSFTREFDLSNFSKGVYFLRLSSENGMAVKRIVIQ